ncbi:PAS domain-containing protein [Candidatus Fukatsuia symbiotica]|uniref:PAS fold-4 domain-containing protein n=1 Tax=Candidatus Fukatsuia symbiotica TaxID=1878942 RepID=A0A2U8I5W0_9GAMM|nr:PAS domain-containing protein [Candidatus Fukatsuia symbiotica]AWK14528.1 hypothetical protein CCS41_08655 [Candidatus Fukatsuia symbiotica]MEA9444821.1 PAS domain-containing protein [Candidatus Fukatsuia symbiotica]
MSENINIQSLPKEIPPQFVAFWKISSEPWAFKDPDSRYRYANSAFLELLDLPPEFNIVDKSDSELPVNKPADSKLPYLDFAKFSQQYRDYEKLAVVANQTVSSIETHCFGREKKIQPYIFDRTPVLNDRKESVGVMLHAHPMSFFTPGQYVEKESPLSLLYDKPDEFFTDEEYDVIFFLLQNISNESIAEELHISVQKVDSIQQGVYEKAQIGSLYDFKVFCKIRGYERYAPQKFLEPSSRMVPLST